MIQDKFFYLFLNLGAIGIPIVASFYPKAPFYKEWRKILPAIILPAIPFIIWDVIFTEKGIWGFNANYLLGLDVFNLPLEEIMFFFCIPYACLFTYFALKFLRPVQLSWKWILPFSAILLTIGILNINKAYTSTTFISLGVLTLFLYRMRWPHFGQFLSSFILILIPFFLINGVLTGCCTPEPIVLYNDSENLGIRMISIPVEDTFYGMLLLLLNCILYERDTLGFG